MAREIIDRYVRQEIQRKATADSEVVREMLGRWVSGLEPSIAVDMSHNIIGLTCAGADFCERPPIIIRPPHQI